MRFLQWCCSERSFPIVPFHLSLHLIAGLKFQAVDLFVSQGGDHLSSERVLAEPEVVAGDLNLLLRAHSMTVGDVRLEVPDLDADGVAAFVHFARCCGATHATWVYHTNHTPAQLQQFSSAAQSAEIRPAVESSAGVSPTALRSIATDITGLTVTLDYGTFLEGRFSEEEVNVLLDLVSHIRVRGTRPGSFQVAWKENSVDYEGIFRKLQAKRYGGCVAADYVWQPARGRNRNDVIAETVQMRRWFDDIL